jgi:putative acetyltransferase
MNIVVRSETALDLSAVFAVHAAAFKTLAEARLVDLLRSRRKAVVSLVASAGECVVGHILFSPVTLNGCNGLGLAPLAVLPQFQNRGIGSRLVLEGLEACRVLRRPFVVVLGNPDYYGRFGFQYARPLGISNQYNVDREFMVIHMGGLPPSGGLATYASEFTEIGV